MSRGGRIIQVVDPSTTSNLSGLWGLNEILGYVNQTKWPRGPAAPTNLTTAAGNAQLLLSWTAPTTTYGTITNYLVEYTPSGGSAVYVLTGSTSTSYILTGLTNGTSYSVRVAAVNFTAGDYSGTASGTPVASALSVLPSSGISESGVAYSWSGSGLVADPLQTSDAPAPGGIAWTWANLFREIRSWNFTCGTSGVLTVEWGGRENEGPEIPSMNAYRRNGILSSVFASSQVFVGTHQARRTLNVNSGDVINLTGGLDKYYGRTLLTAIKGMVAEKSNLVINHVTVNYKAHDWADYRDFIGRSLIYINPTLDSPMPRSRTEAMLSGCLVLTSRHHGASEFIENGVDGFILPDNPTSYAETIDLVLNHHYQEAVEMGQRGKAKAKKLFSQERYQKDLWYLISEVAAGRKPKWNGEKIW